MPRNWSASKSVHCDDCDRDLTYASAYAFSKHKEFHEKGTTDVKTFHCDICNADLFYSNPSYFEKHLRKHTTTICESYHCDYCEKDFIYSSPAFFESHKEMHVEEGAKKQSYEYFCETCEKTLTYACSSSFERHKRQHKRTIAFQTYQCEHCPFTYLYPYALKRHCQKSHHGGSTVCPDGICTKPKLSKPVEADTKQLYPCKICNKTLSYSKYSYFWRHMQTHLSSNVYVCAHCESKCSSPAGLSSHCMYTHHGGISQCPEGICKVPEIRSTSAPECYKGVQRINTRNYCARILIGRRHFVLGTYSSAFYSARLYDEAMHAITRETTELNFPGEHVDCKCQERRETYEDLCQLYESTLVDSFISDNANGCPPC